MYALCGSRVRHIFIAIVTATCLEVDSSGQDKAPEELVKLPELRAFKLSKDDYLLFNARIGMANADFIRSLRKVPAIHAEGTPTSLIMEKYLRKRSKAIKTEFCYIESDWLTDEELALVAAVVQRTTAMTQQLFKNTHRGIVKEVLVRTQEDYYALVDAWSDSEKVKKQARHAASAFVSEHRCGYRGEILDVLTLTTADAVSANLEPYFWNQDALRQGFHTYLTSVMGFGYERYISLDVTTPTVSRDGGVKQLFETAREYLSRPKHDTIATILRSELNDLNPERLAVAFAFIHFLLETQRDHWDVFLSVLNKSSYENDKLKGPEGRWTALLAAIKDALGLDIQELERNLQEFTSKHYLYTEEIASLLGVNRECAESAFQGFVKICELKRLKKPVSEKGEKLYQEILGKIDKKLQSASEKF